MEEFPVRVDKVSRSFGDVRAVSEVSFAVKKGELFGIIGPDGAGKTTLIRMILSLLVPDKGSITVEGFDTVKQYREIRKLAGYMPGRFSLYYDLTVEENLRFYATIFGTTIEESYGLISDIYSQIEPFKTRRAGDLSGGMKQKLALSCALIHKPVVLVLDEPTTGVDAVSRKEFWDVLKSLGKQGITILVSTPYMDEASLCDRVALMQKSRLLEVNTPEGIVRNYPYNLIRIESSGKKIPPTLFEDTPGVVSSHRFGGGLHVAMEKQADTGQLHQILAEQGIAPEMVDRIEPGIEDCFLALMTDNDE
ncbi:MAG: hypothetical protein Kow00127_23570 [Bacteroidales bacterium]